MPNLRLTAFVVLSLAVHGAVGVAFVVKGSKAADVGHEAPPVLAGETFDIGVAEAVVPQNQSLSAVAPTVVATDQVGTENAATKRPATSSTTTTTTTTTTSTSAATAAAVEPLSYGAVGDRSAVEIAVAFTRSFPQASSADPFWESVPFGDCGSTDVTFVLADDGTLESWSASGAPSEALKRAVERTVALIKGRPFIAVGKTTKIRVSARVSPDEAHDGLHGDVFAVGGSYTGGEGTAFFALNISRRVDVTVKAAR
jgi:hypothetical protein